MAAVMLAELAATSRPIEVTLEELRPPLLRFAWSLTSNPDDAEDLVQETLLRVWLALPRLRRPAAALDFALTAMRRLWIDLWRSERRTKREAMLSLECVGLEEGWRILDLGGVSPERAAQRGWLPARRRTAELAAK